MNKYLLIDTHYLAYRAFYALPGLSHDGKATSVSFGVLRDIIELEELHSTKNIIFTFDYGISKRLEIYPQYKENRNNPNKSEEDVQIKSAIREQIDLLRTEYLPQLGFNNIFFEYGYEADDIIASLCKTITQKLDNTCIIISTDKDLYQLLRQNSVSMYDPRNKKPTTEQSFTKEWGIQPSDWITVKSISGCKTDNIQGLDRVGEKTVCKYLNNKLKSTTKAYKNIYNNRLSIEDKNSKLVKLPFPGTPQYKIKPDDVTIKKWKDLTTELGMSSLVNSYPLSALGNVEQKPKTIGFGI